MSGAKKFSAVDLKTDMSSIEMTVLVQYVSGMVSKLAGIQLGAKQAPMVENRLRSRMIKLGINNPKDYRKYLDDHRETESESLLSLMTTHHTFFFREFTQFEFIQQNALKNIIEAARSRGEKKIRIWSAACSRGQEVYSLSMFFKAVLPKLAPDFDFEILGTDIDPESVAIARNGVYPYKEIKEIPAAFLGDHWVRGAGEISDFAKAKKSIREQVSFETMNLLNFSSVVLGRKFDIIMCRNVFIYFSQDQIRSIVQNFTAHMHSQSYLFLGISESLSGMDVPVSSVSPSVYQVGSPPAERAIEKTAAISAARKPIGKDQVRKAPTVQPPKVVEAPLLRVLCVDDSSTILTLLKKVLSKENGFEIVATAMNGIEAAEALKKHKVDLMTLDIHMPEMDGITYLSRYYNSSHPPVVMISTVNRENAETALKAIELGASDYIEKPTMANLSDRGDEICAKLKSAHFNRTLSHNVSVIDTSFKKKFVITEPDKKLRVLSSGLNKSKSLMQTLKHQTAQDPAMVVLFEGAAEALKPFSESISKEVGATIEMASDFNALRNGKIYFIDAKAGLAELEKCSKKISFMVTGVPSKNFVAGVLKLKDIQLLVEDLGDSTPKDLAEIAWSQIPMTSYFSISEEWFE